MKLWQNVIIMTWDQNYDNCTKVTNLLKAEIMTWKVEMMAYKVKIMTYRTKKIEIMTNSQLNYHIKSYNYNKRQDWHTNQYFYESIFVLHWPRIHSGANVKQL